MVIMARGRPRNRKLGDSEFKIELLNSFIDENGEKVSFTTLLNSMEFLDKVGLSKIDKKTGEKIPCSRGTLSYWCYDKKYGVAKYEPFKGEPISDELVYKWGVQEGLISEDVTFDNWTNLHNKNGMVNTKRELNSDRILLNKIAKFLKSSIRASNFNSNVDLFRKFLIEEYGVEKYMMALNSLVGG